MSSLFSAIRSSLEDSWWFVKLSICVVFVYLWIEFTPKMSSNNEALIIFGILFNFILLGCAGVTAFKNINNIFPLFPSLSDIFNVIKKAFGNFFVLLPASVISGIITFLIYSSNMEDVVKYIIYSLIALFFIPIMAFNFILYNVRGKFSDAFRFDIISECVGNVIVSLILLILQVVIIYGILYTCLYFFFVQMFSSEHICIRILTYMFCVITYFTSIVYLAELYGEVIRPLDLPKSQRF